MSFFKRLFNPNTATYWDKLYQQEIGNIKIRRDESVYKLLEQLSDKHKIMDFGSGPGGNIKLLTEKFKNKQFYLIDHSKSALDYGKQSYLGEKDAQNNEFFYYEKISDLGELKVDAIITIQVLEHITNYKQIIDELWDRLEVGGVLIISVPVKGIRIRHREHVNKFTVKSMFNVLSAYSDWVYISPRSYSSKSKILSTAFFSIVKK